MKKIRYFICGNGRGHFVRSASICKILTSTFGLQVYAYIVSSNSNANYADRYFTNLEVVNPLIEDLPFFFNDTIVSDNLILPLWRNRYSSPLLIHIGSFIWTRVSSLDPLFNLLDKPYMEKIFSFNSVHSFVNQYFFNTQIHAPLISHLHTHGLTDLVFSENKSNFTKSPSYDNEFIYISLGLSAFAIEEAQKLYTILSKPRFSNKTFYIDEYIWDRINTLDHIYWIRRRSMSHEYCLANASLLFIRPGLGTLNNILCQKICSPLVACNFSKNIEIESNTISMRKLGYNIFDLEIDTSEVSLANFISNTEKVTPNTNLNFNGINDIANKIEVLTRQVYD